MKKTVVGVALLAMLVCASAQASYLYPWSGTPTFADPVDGVFPGGRDISPGIWYARDASYHYFRMDLRDTPSPLGNNFAGMYGIFIDSKSGGANHGDTDYLPTGVTGIDFILDSHFNNSGTGGWEDQHYHLSWNGLGFSIEALDGYQDTENSGKTIEFKIARNRILDDADAPADEFYIVAATLDVGSSAPTYDLVPDADRIYIPEPASLGLLLIGAVALLRRR